MTHDSHSHHYNLRFAAGAFLNLVFIGFEIYFARVADSAGLLADAVHNLGDVLGLFISWLGFGLARLGSSRLFTFGFKKATILASFLNAILLFAGTGFIISEGIGSLLAQKNVNSIEVMIIATIGIAINGATALLFLRGSKTDINIKSAFLHMLFDALVSLGVVISGIIIFFTEAYIVDAIIAILIGFFIVFTSWGLFTESGKLLFAGTPLSVNSFEVRNFLLAQEGVKSIHDLHIWAISTSINALTFHMVIESKNFNSNFLKKLEALIRAKFHIHHITIQPEEERECQNNC